MMCSVAGEEAMDVDENSSDEGFVIVHNDFQTGKSTDKQTVAHTNTDIPNKTYATVVSHSFIRPTSDNDAKHSNTCIVADSSKKIVRESEKMEAKIETSDDIYGLIDGLADLFTESKGGTCTDTRVKKADSTTEAVDDDFPFKFDLFDDVEDDINTAKGKATPLFAESKSDSEDDDFLFDLFGDSGYSSLKTKRTNLSTGFNTTAKNDPKMYHIDAVQKNLETKAKVENKDTNKSVTVEEVTKMSHKHNNSVVFPNKKDIKRAISEEDFCCICLDKHENPKVLHKCSHKFCTECIEQHFKIKPVCPVCFVAYGVVTGNQPPGHMSHSTCKVRLPGYEKYDSIVVSYSFDNGIQTDEHPHPGVAFTGTSRTGYLPNNEEGQKVLTLLRASFHRRLTFTVGRSRTTGAENVVTWNDIHHKTSTNGGQQSFGYPDPTYLQRVQEELAAFGLTIDSIKENEGLNAFK